MSKLIAWINLHLHRVDGQNVTRHKTSTTKTSPTTKHHPRQNNTLDKTSPWTKHHPGQNITQDKTSPWTKRHPGQNITRTKRHPDKTSPKHFLSFIYSS